MLENAQQARKIKISRPMSAAGKINLHSFVETKNPMLRTDQPDPEQVKSLAKSRFSRPQSAVQLPNNKILMIADQPKSRFTHASMSIRPRSAHIKIKTGGVGMQESENGITAGSIFIL